MRECFISRSASSSGSFRIIMLVHGSFLVLRPESFAGKAVVFSAISGFSLPFPRPPISLKMLQGIGLQEFFV